MCAGIVEEITDEGGDICFWNTKHGCYPFTTMLGCCKTWIFILTRINVIF